MTPRELSDAELHALILTGDEAALATWEERVRPEVLRMLTRAGCAPEDAEEIWADAVIATWQRLWREPPLTPPGESLRAYAFRVARIRRVKLLETRERTIRASPIHDETDEATLPEERHGPESPAVLRLRECLERLGERVRLVAELLMEQTTRSELAAILRISETSVAKIVQRTKATLARCIEEEVT